MSQVVQRSVLECGKRLRSVEGAGGRSIHGSVVDSYACGTGPKSVG